MICTGKIPAGHYEDDPNDLNSPLHGQVKLLLRKKKGIIVPMHIHLFFQHCFQILSPVASLDQVWEGRVRAGQRGTDFHFFYMTPTDQKELSRNIFRNSSLLPLNLWRPEDHAGPRMEQKLRTWDPQWFLKC